MNYKGGTLILGDTLIPDSGVDKARFSLKSICLKKKSFSPEMQVTKGQIKP